MVASSIALSPTYTFAGTGEELIVNSYMSNDTGATLATIHAAEAGNTVTNRGLITGIAGLETIQFDLGGTINNFNVIAGVVGTGGDLTFTNRGTFVGAILVHPSEPVSSNVITNKGTMTYSGFWAVAGQVDNAVMVLGDGNDTVTNTGKILGDVLLGNGTNTFDGRGGAILGTVYGGTGDDTYWLAAATAISDAGGTDTINARSSYTLGAGVENLNLIGYGNFTGNGNSLGNMMVGNTSSNVLNGLIGNDTILGGNGNDTIDGGTANDSLDGGNGSDLLIGGFGVDTLVGGIGNDTLDGGTGADSMDGGDGADVLIGGSFGTDTLTGGAGADNFVFTIAADSPATLKADVITDFGVGADKIDFSALVPGDLSFVGSGPFSIGAPSVRVIPGTLTSLGNTVVQADLNGDGKVDMQVFLIGLHDLTDTSFVL